MTELSPQEMRDELIFLVSEGIEEIRTGSSKTAVSILIEAQCLIAGAIEAELNKLCSPPSLAPPDDLN